MTQKKLDALLFLSGLLFLGFYSAIVVLHRSTQFFSKGSPSQKEIRSSSPDGKFEALLEIDKYAHTTLFIEPKGKPLPSRGPFLDEYPPYHMQGEDL